MLERSMIKFLLRGTRPWLWLAMITFYAVSAQAQTAVKTGISGVVNDDKGPIPGATLLIEETKQTLVSGNKGDFFIPLKPGSYTLTIRFIGLKAVTRNVTVLPGRVENLKVSMTSDARMLGTVVVQSSRKATSAHALLDIRRSSSNIQDAIGAQEIEKTASITTAQALARVTGVTVKDGKYVTVRGLTDRNIVVQLNGSRMPGADASRSSVGLDLVPAQLLENIIVEKSITADKPGDANGAVVDITTKSIPDNDFLEVNVQSGSNGNIGIGGYANSFQDAKMGFFGQNVRKQNLTQDYLDLQTDYTARGASIPRGTFGAALNAAIGNSAIDQAHYASAMRINQVMEQGFSPYLTTKARQYPMDQIYGITMGKKYQLKGEKVLGVILGVNYYNRSQSNPNGQVNLYTTKIPSSSSTGEPNIIYPNESRLVNLYRLNENTGQQQLNYGGLATLSFRFNKFNEVSFTYNGNYGTETNATLEDGSANSNLQVPNINVQPSFPPDQHIYDNILRTTERSLHLFQLRGDHKFRIVKKLTPWQLSYSGSHAIAMQNDPDYRETRVRVDSNGLFPYLNPLTNQSSLVKSEYQYTYFAESDRYYRKLNEQNNNARADLLIPFNINKKTDGSVFKTGAYYLQRERDYNETVTNRTDLSQGINGPYGTPNQVAGNLTSLGGNLDAWASAAQIGVRENQNVADGTPLASGYLYVPQAGINIINKVPFVSSYHATQQIIAFYGMADMHFTDAWRLVAGLRVENTDYRSTPDTLNTNFSAISKVVDQEDFDRRYRTNYLTYNWLPSGSVIYKGVKNMNFRLAYSRTLIRPEINEITLSSQRDPIQQITVYGNKDLRNGVFNNYDFRTDLFIGQDELISGSVFYKQVTDQLERVYQPSSANGSSIDQFGFQNSYVTFRNNPQVGKVYGIEVEVRKNLKSLFPFGQYINIGTNLLLAKSETTIDSVGYRVITLIDRSAVKTRPLVDQPNYSINVNADISYPKWGSQLNVLFNKVGKRLSDINADGTPNIYEYPAPSFDMVYSQRITKKIQLKAFVKNLFNSETKYLYANAGGADTYGIDNNTYVRRSFSYGSVYTLGIKYTF